MARRRAKCVSYEGRHRGPHTRPAMLPGSMALKRFFGSLFNCAGYKQKLPVRQKMPDWKQEQAGDYRPAAGFTGYPQKRMAALASSAVGSTVGVEIPRRDAARGSSVQPRMK